jgi:hypothetical protein
MLRYSHVNSIRTEDISYREHAVPRDTAPRRPAYRAVPHDRATRGAECPALPQRLVDLFSASDPAAPAWSRWDHELVEKVSADHRIPAALVTSLEASGYSRIDDLLAGVFRRPDDLVILHRVKDAIRDLARSGRAILVGHGSVFMTHDLPGGIHIRLVAPLNVRVRNVSARFGISFDQALRQMRRVERQRRTFFRRFWPDRPLAPEMFSAVFNTAMIDEERLVRAVAELLPR